MGGGPRLTRRRATTILAELAALPAVAVVLAACGSSTPRPTAGSPTTTTTAYDGYYLCDQSYALCTGAQCETVTTTTSTTVTNTVVCRCPVLDGYSMSSKTCAERAPTGNTVVSGFSTQNYPSDQSLKVMTCPGSVPWANCLDITCTVDGNMATCNCLVVSGDGAWFTFGGDCDTQMCTQGVWSGAVPPGVPYVQAMQKAHQGTPEFPPSCPSSS